MYDYYGYEIDMEKEKVTFLDMDHSYFDSKLQNYFLELCGNKNLEGTYKLEDDGCDIHNIKFHEPLIKKLQNVRYH